MKYLPVGRQNFEAIIKEDLVYVDKTKQIHNLKFGKKHRYSQFLQNYLSTYYFYLSSQL